MSGIKNERLKGSEDEGRDEAATDASINESDDDQGNRQIETESLIGDGVMDDPVAGTCRKSQY